MAFGLLIPGGLAAKDKVPQHQDPYMTGSQDESRIAKAVRHQLLMLPYFGVFDDLGFWPGIVRRVDQRDDWVGLRL